MLTADEQRLAIILGISLAGSLGVLMLAPFGFVLSAIDDWEPPFPKRSRPLTARAERVIRLLDAGLDLIGYAAKYMLAQFWGLYVFKMLELRLAFDSPLGNLPEYAGSLLMVYYGLIPLGLCVGRMVYRRWRTLRNMGREAQHEPA